MVCLSSDRIAELNAERESKKEQLDKANETLLSLLSETVSWYRFDDQEGSMQVRDRSIKELRETINWLQSEINYIDRLLAGGGVSAMRLRRWGG